METTLLIVTAASLIVALVMSYTTWRLGREERQRSAARVAALAAAAGVSPAEIGVGVPNVDRVGPRAIDPVKALWSRSPISSSEPRTSGPVSLDIRHTPSRVEPDFDDQLNSGTVEPRPILGSSEEPRPSGNRQRKLAMAAVALFAVLGGGLAWTISARAPSVDSAASANAPLELVSLRHERQSSKLAVSGLVRNPAAGHPVDRLTAVVFLFDQQGSFVTSAKAPVDFVRLGSGDESPFVISVEAAATIARYRVSFLTDQGIVPHVDRRGASPIATQAEQAVSLKAK